MTSPRLKTNLGILVLGDAAGKLINVFTFGRLGRVLGPGPYGHLEWVLAAIFVGALVIEAGLGPWGARAIARGGEPASRIAGRVLALRAMILVLVLIVVGVIAAILGGGGDDSRAVLLVSAAIMLVPKAALLEWLFQGRNEMAAVTSTTILEPIVALAGTLALVHGPADVGRVPFILAAAIAAVALAQHVLAWRRGARPELRHGLDSAGALLRESLPLGLSTLAWAVRFFSPMLAVGWITADAGAFGAAHRLVVSMHAVVWLWFFNLLPHWSWSARQPALLEKAISHSLRSTAGLAALLVGAVWFLAPLLTAKALYGEAYEQSVGLLRLLAVVPALAWISGNFRFGLIAKGALKAELAASLAGAAFAVIALGALVGAVLPDWRVAWAAAGIFCGAEAVTLYVAWLMWRRTSRGPRAAPTATGTR